MDLGEFVAEVMRAHVQWIDGRLRALADGERLCVHDEPMGEYGIRTGAHVLQPVEVCRARQRRTQYGPMTPEIRAQVAAFDAEKSKAG